MSAAALLIVGVLCGQAPSVAFEPGSAAALLDRAFSNLYAEDYVQTLTLATRSRGGREMRRKLQITRRQSVRPGRALLRFLYPQTIRRTSVLIIENEGASDDLYVYLPAVKITRHLSSAQRADSFFGTALSYEDVEPKRAEEWTVVFAGEGEAAGRPCTLLDVTAAPGFTSTYDRQVSCIERERAIILRTEFYVKDKIVKVLTIDPKEVRHIGERYVPFLITITNHRMRSETRVITDSYELRAEIPDRIFNTWNLAAGDAKSDRNKTTPAEAVAPPAVVHRGE